jgi:hypothetical protein
MISEGKVKREIRRLYHRKKYSEIDSLLQKDPERAKYLSIEGKLVMVDYILRELSSALSRTNKETKQSQLESAAIKYGMENRN